MVPLRGPASLRRDHLQCFGGASTYFQISLILAATLTRISASGLEAEG
jgi:hypothetical protein